MTFKIVERSNHLPTPTLADYKVAINMLQISVKKLEERIAKLETMMK